MNMRNTQLKDFLNDKVYQYNNPDFIELDPISIPHKFELKEDIEIAGFLAATIAWGRRNMIVRNANKMMDLMGNSPYDFVMEASIDRIDQIEGSIHRTFNSIDFKFFIKSLRNIYKHHGGLEQVFSNHTTESSTQPSIHEFKELFFSIHHPSRTTKHVSDPNKGSAAKRINMYLRWMVRNDNNGVDFGLWKSISPSILSCPLDVHSGNISRKLGLLTRKQNDAKAVKELDDNLRLLDPDDPVKYDFALFGLGVFDDF